MPPQNQKLIQLSKKLIKIRMELLKHLDHSV